MVIALVTSYIFCGTDKNDTGIDLSKDPMALQRVREAAENAKQYGYNDNDYSIHGNYYNSQTNKTINKINQINQESEN